jgi:hypothetical protein
MPVVRERISETDETVSNGFADEINESKAQSKTWTIPALVNLDKSRLGLVPKVDDMDAAKYVSYCDVAFGPFDICWRGSNSRCCTLSQIQVWISMYVFGAIDSS